jgi:hypothetical protein
VTASTRSAGSYPHALVLLLPPLYTCRSLVIEQANQVRTLDITCVPMAPGWVYLVAVLDWASHWARIPTETDLAVDAAQEAGQSRSASKSATRTKAISSVAPNSSLTHRSAELTSSKQQ